MPRCEGPERWLRYDKCGCGAEARKPCLDLRMAGSVRTVGGRAHVGRPHLPKQRSARR